MKEVRKKKKTFAERVDGVVEFFSPQRALKRRMYRYANKTAFRAYRGADKDRLRKSWLPGGGSADEDLLLDLPDLRERSRDLNRNDPHAAGITASVVTNVVGTGIRPQSRVDKESLGLEDEKVKLFQKRAERIWQKWIPFADAGDRMDFNEIQRLVERQILENGEVIVAPLRLDEPRRPYSLALQVIEADRLVTPLDKISDRKIRHGVEVGERGQPVAYWIRKTHPGEAALRLRTPKADQCTRYPAYNELGRPNLLHLYWVKRPGQTRGIPFFAPVVNLFKDLADYLEAELVGARVAACFTVFITKNDPGFNPRGNQSSYTNAQGQRIEELEPAMIKHLAEGESISFANPSRPGNTFDPFVERILRTIGAGLGLPYEITTKDFSKTNYSSARAAILEGRKFLQGRQSWLSKRLCQPAWEMVLEEAYLKGELPVDSFYKHRLDLVRAHWIPDGWGWVDPTKEVKAAQIAMECGISSLADENAAKGKDWEETIEQLAREKIKIKGLEDKNKIKITSSSKPSNKAQDDEDEDEKDDDKEEKPAKPAGQREN